MNKLANIKMRYSLFILLLLLIFSDTYSQDTLYVYEKEYYTSEIKSGSILNESSSRNGFNLISFNDPKCGILDFKRKPNYGIINPTKSGDTIIIGINQYLNCGPKYLGEIDAHTSSINLIYKPIGTKAECMCSRLMIYKILSKKSMPQSYLINGKKTKVYKDLYKTSKPKYKVRGNDTINFIDRYGIKQGDFIKYRLSGDTMQLIKYLNGEIIEKMEYSKNGNLTEYLRFDYKVIQEFIVIRQGVIITRWDDKGTIIVNKQMSMSEYYKMYK